MARPKQALPLQVQCRWQRSTQPGQATLVEISVEAPTSNPTPLSDLTLKLTGMPALRTGAGSIPLGSTCPPAFYCHKVRHLHSAVPAHCVGPQLTPCCCCHCSDSCCSAALLLLPTLLLPIVAPWAIYIIHHPTIPLATRV